MKFLCVACDEAMQLKEARGPEEGSMTVVFGCPTCGTEVAMLTNTMETQVVRSLGVKIGGRTAPAESMEMVRSSLVYRRDGLEAAAAATPADGGPVPEGAGRSEPKCPFTGVVEEAYARASEGITWTSEAEARLERIPSYVRPMVRKSIEQHAHAQGYTQIDTTVLAEVRGQFGL